MRLHPNRWGELLQQKVTAKDIAQNLVDYSEPVTGLTLRQKFGMLRLFCGGLFLADLGDDTSGWGEIGVIFPKMGYRVMKRPFCACLWVFLFCCTGALWSQSGQVQAILLRVDSKPVAVGGSSTATIHLNIKEGFKVPKRPVSKLQLSTIPEIEVRGTLNLTEEGTGKDPGYFAAFKPVVLQISPSKSARVGQYQLEGKFTYFFCSERDKFCSRSVESFRIPVEVSGVR